MKYIFGNWKMHGLRHEAESLALNLAGASPPLETITAIFPPLRPFP